MALIHSPNIVMDGLVVCWDAANTKSYTGSGTTWTDITGKGHTATVNGATFSTLNGGVWDFDNTNDYIESPDADAWYPETNYTAECWFNCDAIGGGGGWNAIFGQWPNSNVNATNSWILEYVGTDLRFYYITSSGSALSYKSLGTVSTGAWHHFVFSKAGSTTKMFIDGIQVVDDFDIGTMQNGTGVFTIGGNVASYGWFNGKIPLIRIYKGKGFTAAEVTQNYNALKGRYG